MPPHERPWRHPSELAATARAELVAEPATTSVKLLTLSVGTLTLVALAVVVVTFTPDRVDQRLADRATPSTVASALLDAGRVFVAELTSSGDAGRPSVTTVAAEPSPTPRVALAAPGARDRVTALTDPPVQVTYSRLRATLVTVDAPDGTVVVAAGGRLVGVWTTSGGAGRLVTAAELSEGRRAVPLGVATTVGPD